MGSGTGVSPDHRATEGQIEDELLALVTQLTNEINWYMRERGLTGLIENGTSDSTTTRPRNTCFCRRQSA